MGSINKNNVNDIEVSDEFREFISLSHDLFLKEQKRIDSRENNAKNEKEKNIILKEERLIISEKLNNFFNQTDFFINGLSKEEYKLYQNYCHDNLDKILLEKCIIPNHMYTKPLGYAGDFVMMNYILDYSGDNNYIGDTIFYKIINNYACNLMICRSNVARRDYLKERISELIRTKNNSQIFSIGSGSAREFVELVGKLKDANKVQYYCLDFEEKAIMFVKDYLSKIKYDIEKWKVSYIFEELSSFIRNKCLKDMPEHIDFVYISGVFDYLSDRLCSRVIKNIIPLINKGGKLIICNISAENQELRSCYEFFCDWVMIHRTKHQMLDWIKAIEFSLKPDFINVKNGTGYHFLEIIKL